MFAMQNNKGIIYILHRMLLILLLLVFLNYQPIVGANLKALNRSYSPQVTGRLVFAHVLFRHGDRMPIDPYPTDPYRYPEDWPYGFGQLSNIGKRQHHELGQWFRKRYYTLLSDQYSENDIHVQSTDVDRTLMSAASNLAGLYPPIGEQVWDDQIPWQPIPIHTIPEEQDSVLAMKKNCPAYDELYQEFLRSPFIQNLNNRYQYIYQYLSKYVGYQVTSVGQVNNINNTLFIEGLYNKTLPDWTRKIYPSADMTFLSSIYFASGSYTREMARLKVGPLIKDIFHRFQQKLNGSTTLKLYMYSAHDSTVANLLSGLKLFDLHSPDYASCVLMEMRLNDQNQPYISVFYKNSSRDPAPLFIPNCGLQCPLAQMIALYSEVIPDDWEKECQLSTMLLSYENANISTAMGILVAIISVMLFLSYVIMIYYRRRNYRNYLSYSQVA